MDEYVHGGAVKRGVGEWEGRSEGVRVRGEAGGELGTFEWEKMHRKHESHSEHLQQI